jgi:cell division protein FtsI (penicillin-binding protein 3)
VMIDEPSGASYYGGDIAGPVFAQVMSGSLRTMGVRPDAPILPTQVARQTVAPLPAPENM